MSEKRFLWIYLAILLLSSVALTKTSIASDYPWLYVDPPTSNANPPESLTIDINIANVTIPGLTKWELKLRFDPRILYTKKDWIIADPDDWFSQGGTYMTSFTSLVAANYIQASGVYAEPADPYGATGNGTLFEVTFDVKDTGNCTLYLYDITLKDPNDDPLPYDPPQHGTFYTNIPRAGCTIKPSTEPYNLGTPEYRNPSADETLTFNATYSSALKDYSSYDPDGEIVSWQWDFGDGQTDTGEIVTHAYETAGPYTVNLTVTDNDGYTDTELKAVTVELHDIAIADIEVSPTTMRPGEQASINITVVNEGLHSEYFNITCYYDNTAIWYNETYDSGGVIFNLTAYSSPFIYDPGTGTRGVALEKGENMTVTFTWNTTGVDEGTYTVRANASLVDQSAKFLPGEIDLADNEETVPDILLALGAPVADFTFSPEHPVPGQIVTFNASASNDSPPGWIESFTWDFGDNTPILTVDNATKVVTHSYANAETHYVTLNVTDNEGFSSIKTKSVKVSVHDITIYGISVDPKIVTTGENASIYVLVRNEGGFDETFNVTAYCEGYLIEPAHTNVILMAGKTGAYEFTWNTTGLSIGTYTISANASAVPNEINTTNNFYIAEKGLGIIGHNIAIQSINVSPTTVATGGFVSVNVTVRNVGNFTETFNVTTYYDGNVVETISGVALAAGTDTTLTFTWDTTEVTVGDYTLKAEASVVHDETNTADNTKTYGIVTVEKVTSTISITASPTTIAVGETITISGAINPTRVGATVKIHWRISGPLEEREGWNELTTVTTNEISQYSYIWTPEESATYDIKASWLGDPSTTTGDSDIKTVTVEDAPGPDIILYAVAGIAVAAGAIVILIYFLRFRKPSSPS